MWTNPTQEETTIGHSAIHEAFTVLALAAVLGSPFIAAGLERWGLTGPRHAMVALDRALVLPLATASLAVGLIHLLVIRAHFAEDPLTGVFFVAVAVFQLAWGVMYAKRPQPGLAGLAAVVNALVVVAWLVSRTTGLPFGAHPGIAEPAGVSDVFATGYELFLIAGTVPLALPRLRAAARRPRWAAPSVDLAVVMALVVITLTASYAVADIAVTGGHPSATASRGDLP